MLTSIHPLVRKFQNFGLIDAAEMRALSSIVRPVSSVLRSHDIVGESDGINRVVVLLAGMACRYRSLEGGFRQILAFYHPGDLCNYDTIAFKRSDYAISALTPCTIATVSHSDIARVVETHPNLMRIFWCDATVNSSIFAEWLVNIASRPAIQRVAHILCEQMVRLEAVGQPSNHLPLTQLDLADATGLSAVHINRTIQILRESMIIGRQNRPITILQPARLSVIGQFDGAYLQMPEAVARWRGRTFPAPLERATGIRRQSGLSTRPNGHPGKPPLIAV